MVDAAIIAKSGELFRGSLDFMWNKGYNDMPLTAGVYYTKTNYQLKDKRYVDNTKLKNDEFGVKVGLAF